MSGLNFDPKFLLFYQIYGKVKIGKIDNKPVKYYKSIEFSVIPYESA